MEMQVTKKAPRLNANVHKYILIIKPTFIKVKSQRPLWLRFRDEKRMKYIHVSFLSFYTFNAFA